MSRNVHVNVQIKEAAEEYEAARLSRVSLGPEVSQAPRAVLADVMFSLLEFKPLQQHLRWVNCGLHLLTVVAMCRACHLGRHMPRLSMSLLNIIGTFLQFLCQWQSMHGGAGFSKV